ncbi:MAG: carbohydrate ABC transporter permease [Alkaliphilus sp.]
MKKANKAALLSVLFMGLGQQYNKERIKGLIFSLINVIVLINIPNFSHALWGLFTLGETPQYFVGGIAYGDHSIFLLIEGIIAVIIIFVLSIVYALNIADAHRTAVAIEKGGKPKTITQTVTSTWSKHFPYVVISPALLFILFFTVLPLLFSIAIAFTNYSIPFHLPPRNLLDWVGFDNFINIFRMEIWGDTFWGVGIWTIIWAFLASSTTYITGLLLAVIINIKGIRFKKLWRSIYILPFAVPGFISLLIMRLLFTGLGPVNTFLASLGLERIPWFTDPFLAKVVLVAVNIWLGAPYFMALMSGVLTNISNELYEAADIDGATGKQKFFKITFPLVLHATMPLLILSFTFNFNNFMMIYVLTEGGPANAAYHYAGHTDILISWIYKLTLEQGQFHMASVVSIILFILIATASAITFSRTKSFKEEDIV